MGSRARPWATPRTREDSRGAGPTAARNGSSLTQIGVGHVALAVDAVREVVALRGVRRRARVRARAPLRNDGLARPLRRPAPALESAAPVITPGEAVAGLALSGDGVLRALLGGGV